MVVSRKSMWVSLMFRVILMLGISAFRKSWYSCSSSRVPGQMKKMSSRNLKNRYGFILKPSMASLSRSIRYRFARFGAKVLPIAVPNTWRYSSWLKVKSLLVMMVVSSFIISSSGLSLCRLRACSLLRTLSVLVMHMLVFSAVTSPVTKRWSLFMVSFLILPRKSCVLQVGGVFFSQWFYEVIYKVAGPFRLRATIASYGPTLRHIGLGPFRFRLMYFR